MTIAKINIPQSTSTVSVKAFNVFAESTNIPIAMVWEPVLPGRETFHHLPGYAFLIEHKESKRRVMFDLGMRKDHDSFSPQIQTVVLSNPDLHFIVERDIVEQLRDGGVELESIETVIWSHSHLDHTGDMSKWPSSTRLIIGPGSDRKGYPSVLDALLLDSDFAGREVEELTFADSSLRIAGLAAIDYFKDGSLYIIDMPGHLPGHIVALTRVKHNSFILLGGDTCHHIGQIRPNPHIHKSFPCPGSLLRVINDGESFPKVEAAMTISADVVRHNEIVFIVPRNDNILLMGGFTEPHNWNLDLTLDSPIMQRMKARCEAFLPALKNARLDPEFPMAQGLRPFRGTNIRVERELRRLGSGTSPSRIIHSYGHGGAGWSLSFGCAGDVLRLVEEALMDLKPKGTTSASGFAVASEAQAKM